MILIELSDVHVDRLMWSSSPLLVLFKCMEACYPSTVLWGGIHQPLWLDWLANLTHPDAHHICYASQIFLAKQVVMYGVDVNAVMPNGSTSLHAACCSTGVINLEYIEFLLQSGANPNAKDRSGRTPLTYTIDWAPGAAKVLIEWPATDVNIVTRSGISMLVYVRMAKLRFPGTSDNPSPQRPRRAAEDQLLLQQWLEVEEMLLERGAQ